MQGPGDKRNLLPLLRECKQLDVKRQKDGLTPGEHDRWLQLKDALGAKLAPSERERRTSRRVPTKINVSFETPDAFREAVISNVSQGGVFVSTSYPSDIGTKLSLSLRIESSGTQLDLPCVVVSQNVGANFSTRTMGMGLRFAELSQEQRAAVDELYSRAAVQADHDAGAAARAAAERALADALTDGDDAP